MDSSAVQKGNSRTMIKGHKGLFLQEQNGNEDNKLEKNVT